MEHLSLSLVDRVPRELALVTMSQLYMTMQETSMLRSWDLTLGAVQVDNQMALAVFPVMLTIDRGQVQQAPVPSEWQENMLAVYCQQVLNLGREESWRARRERSLQRHFRLLSVYVKPVVVRLDDACVRSLLLYVSVFRTQDTVHRVEKVENVVEYVMGGEMASPRLMNVDRDEGRRDVASVRVNRIFLDELDLGAWSVNLSYRTQPQTRLQADLLTDPMGAFVESLGALISNVDNAVLSLERIHCPVRVSSAMELWQMIMVDYQAMFVSQLWTVLGSSQLLGNPSSLMSNVQSGWKDLMTEQKVYRGMFSLIGKSGRGLANTASSLTQSLGSGLVVLSGDRAAAERRAEMWRAKPKSAMKGIKAGGKHILFGLRDGVRGLFEAPAEGAAKGGFTGALAGIGRGVLGLVFKPMTGLVDAVSAVTGGIAATHDEKGASRVRDPRMVSGREVSLMSAAT